MSPRPFSEKTYYSALALCSLGRENESAQLLADLLKFAENLRKTQAQLDYFATSLPAMLLFDDDLQSRQTTHANLLAAQAHLGLGEIAKAEVLLNQILRQDPNHALAADLSASLNSEKSHAQSQNHPR
jgi:hypothetical protein